MNTKMLEKMFLNKHDFRVGKIFKRTKRVSYYEKKNRVSVAYSTVIPQNTVRNSVAYTCPQN